MCLFAAQVRPGPDDLDALAKFIGDGEQNLHLCAGCSIAALKNNEIEGTELSDNDATSLSVIVGASGLDSVNKDDYISMIIDSMLRDDVLLQIKSLEPAWIQAKIKDIGLPAFMQWLADEDDDGNFHGCTIVINRIDQLHYQDSAVKASVTRTITAAKKKCASLH